jgi:hypothetical protein
LAASGAAADFSPDFDFFDLLRLFLPPPAVLPPTAATAATASETNKVSFQ